MLLNKLETEIKEYFINIWGVFTCLIKCNKITMTFDNDTYLYNCRKPHISLDEQIKY